VLRAALSPLGEREFRLLFLGRAVSLFGTAFAPIALAFAVLDLTGSASDLGLVVAAGFVPQLVFILVGGIWADRLRHHVMVVSDLVAGERRPRSPCSSSRVSPRSGTWLHSR
jgi:MFS family permease